jgi:hypothetical protein
MVSEPEAAAIYATRYLNRDQKNKILKASLFAQLSFVGVCLQPDS